jgi:hypothetical protein
MRRIETNNIKTATYLAFALIPLSGFVMAIYIPSLPEMSSQLHTTPVQYGLYRFSLYNNTAYWNRFYIQYRIFILSYPICN